MNKKLLGYGVLIWVVAYLVAVAFVGYKVMDEWWAKTVIIIVVAVLTLWAGTKLHQPSHIAVLRYSALWLITAVILDILLTVPFTGWGFFMSWDLWTSYVLVIFLPLITNKRNNL